MGPDDGRRGRLLSLAALVAVAAIPRSELRGLGRPGSHREARPPGLRRQSLNHPPNQAPPPLFYFLAWVWSLGFGVGPALSALLPRPLVSSPNRLGRGAPSRPPRSWCCTRWSCASPLVPSPSLVALLLPLCLFLFSDSSRCSGWALPARRLVPLLSVPIVPEGALPPLPPRCRPPSPRSAFLFSARPAPPPPPPPPGSPGRPDWVPSGAPLAPLALLPPLFPPPFPLFPSHLLFPPSPGRSFSFASLPGASSPPLPPRPPPLAFPPPPLPPRVRPHVPVSTHALLPGLPPLPAGRLPVSSAPSPPWVWGWWFLPGRCPSRRRGAGGPLGGVLPRGAVGRAGPAGAPARFVLPAFAGGGSMSFLVTPFHGGVPLSVCPPAPARGARLPPSLRCGRRPPRRPPRHPAGCAALEGGRPSPPPPPPPPRVGRVLGTSPSLSATAPVRPPPSHAASRGARSRRGPEVPAPGGGGPLGPPRPIAFESDVDLDPARLVRDVVEVALRIRVPVVDRRRQDAVAQRERAHHRLERPAAPKQWPVTDFVDETASRYAWSPKTCFSARVSARSPSGVEVPCALT